VEESLKDCGGRENDGGMKPLKKGEINEKGFDGRNPRSNPKLRMAGGLI